MNDTPTNNPPPPEGLSAVARAGSGSELAEAGAGEFVFDQPWKAVFIRGLRVMDNVTSAAKLAGINPRYVYEVRANDPVFAAAWADAKEQATDTLEVYAHRMSTEGLEVTETRRTVKKQLMGEGASARLVVVEETEVAVTNRMVSPQMMMFLLAAARPDKYSRKARMEHVGPDGGPVRIESLHAIDVRIAELRRELEPGDEHPVIEGTGQ